MLRCSTPLKLWRFQVLNHNWFAWCMDHRYYSTIIFHQANEKIVSTMLVHITLTFRSAPAAHNVTRTFVFSFFFIIIFSVLRSLSVFISCSHPWRWTHSIPSHPTDGHPMEKHFPLFAEMKLFAIQPFYVDAYACIVHNVNMKILRSYAAIIIIGAWRGQIKTMWLGKGKWPTRNNTNAREWKKKNVYEGYNCN